MPRRLPQLTSLRAFEAAGRHLSFTQAASELAVTQAAISHQVKSLEEYLGVALFVRLPRKLELTEPGNVLLPVVQHALDSISQAIAELRETEEKSVLCIAVAPSFAAKWLTPRLDGFLRTSSESELSLKHTNSPVDFDRQEVDVAITYGHGDWPGVISEPLLQLDFFPVCSPSFLRGDKAIGSISDLGMHTLLHDSDYETWRDWLALAGASDVDPKRGNIVDDTNVLIRAAIDGIGIAMCSEIFVEDHLATGRLVKPFDITLTSDSAYYAVCPKSHLNRANVSDFWNWLLGQAQDGGSE